MNLLDTIDLGSPSRHVQEERLTFAVVRDLTEADLPLIEKSPALAVGELKNLRERHHMLARLLAQGTTLGQASAMTGYTPPRINQLLGDPTFKELVLFYRGEVEIEYLDTHTTLALVTNTAAQQLLDKLEDEPEKISDSLRLEILKAAADRSGHGPQSQTTSLNVNVDMAERMERARARRALPPAEK